jgi:hypothetical protein
VSSDRSPLWDYAGCALLAVTPIANHMVYHHLRLQSIDAAALLGLALGFGLLAGHIVRRLPGGVRVLALILVTVAFLDLQFDVETRIPFWAGAVAAAGVVALLRRRYTQIVTLSVGTILATVPLRASLAVQSWTAPGATASPTLVPIVHLILDEHSAARAFPADIAEAGRARARMLDFYQRHGFRLYDNAYSRYYWSHASIPAELAPLDDNGQPAALHRDKQGFVVTGNELFQRAAALGYRTRVFQTSYLDACERARSMIASCRTYPANSLESLRLLPLTAPRRVLLEVAYFLSSESSLVRRFRFRINRQMAARMTHDTEPATDVWEAGRAGAGMAILAMADLRRDLRANLPGSYYFGHFLIPHYPYELGRDCRALTHPGDRLGPWPDGQRHNTTASRRIRWQLYAGQIECLYTHLDSLMAAIEAAAPAVGVMVVVQGDHGSRIVRNAATPRRASDLTERDLIDGFATLLAVRGPGIVPGIDSTVVAVQSFIPSWLLGRIGQPTWARQESVPTIVLESWDRSRDPPVLLAAPSLGR